MIFISSSSAMGQYWCSRKYCGYADENKRSWLANADGPSESQSRCEYFPGKRQEMALTCDGKFNGAITYELVCTGNMCSDLTMNGGLLDSTAAIAKGTFFDYLRTRQAWVLCPVCVSPVDCFCRLWTNALTWQTAPHALRRHMLHRQQRAPVLQVQVRQRYLHILVPRLI